MRHGVAIKCEICQIPVRGMPKYRSHMEEVHGNAKPKPYACSVCDKRFARKFILKQHAATHQDAESRTFDFKCSRCGKAFAQKSNLTRHLRNRHEVPFKCRKCPMRFKTNTQMLAHTLAKHPRYGKDASAVHRGKKLKNMPPDAKSELASKGEEERKSADHAELAGRDEEEQRKSRSPPATSSLRAIPLAEHACALLPPLSFISNDDLASYMNELEKALDSVTKHKSDPLPSHTNEPSNIASGAQHAPTTSAALKLAETEGTATPVSDGAPNNESELVSLLKNLSTFLPRLHKIELLSNSANTIAMSALNIASAVHPFHITDPVSVTPLPTNKFFQQITPPGGINQAPEHKLSACESLPSASGDIIEQFSNLGISNTTLSDLYDPVEYTALTNRLKQNSPSVAKPSGGTTIDGTIDFATLVALNEQAIAQLGGGKASATLHGHASSNARKVPPLPWPSPQSTLYQGTAAATSAKQATAFNHLAQRPPDTPAAEKAKSTVGLLAKSSVCLRSPNTTVAAEAEMSARALLSLSGKSAGHLSGAVHLPQFELDPRDVVQLLIQQCAHPPREPK